MKLFSFHPGETFVINFVLPFQPCDVRAVVMSFRDRNRVVYETVATSFKAEVSIIEPEETNGEAEQETSPEEVQNSSDQTEQENQTTQEPSENTEENTEEAVQETSDETEGEIPEPIVIERTRVGYMLTQSETLLFEEYHDYVMQINVYGPNSSRIASKEIEIRTTGQQIIDPVIGGDPALDTIYSTHRGVVDYNTLTNRPQINTRVLEGNRTMPEESISIGQINQIISDT